MDLTKLAEPFPTDDIEWRIGRAGYSVKGQLYGTCLAYINNRAIMQRLDDVCGPANWRNEYKEWNVGKNGVLCGISINVAKEGMDPIWVTKWDGAENTDIEAIKGGLSDSMKRAAVQWGIGRYLYKLEEGFAVITDDGQYIAKGKDKYTAKDYKFHWNPPKLPEWALPATEKAKAKPVAKEPEKPSPKPKEATQDQLTKIDTLCGQTNTSLTDLRKLYKLQGEDIPTDEQAKAMIASLQAKHSKMLATPSISVHAPENKETFSDHLTAEGK